MCAAVAGGALDLEERTVLGVRLARIDNEVIGQNELGQRMRPAVSERPIGLSIKTVPEREIGIQPRPVGALIAFGKLEPVSLFVEITDFQVTFT